MELLSCLSLQTLLYHIAAVVLYSSSILLLVAYGHQNCIIYTKADVQLRTPDDGQKGCLKHVEL